MQGVASDSVEDKLQQGINTNVRGVTN